MGFFLNSLKIHIKRIICTPVFISSVVLLTVLLLACSFFLSGKENIATVNIGILSVEPDVVTEKAASILLNNNRLNFIRFDASQLDEMTGMVKSRRLECAYIFEKGFLKNVKAERFDNIITLITSPATVASGITNELVFAAVIEASADIISAQIASDMFGLEYEDIAGVFTEKIEAYHAGGIFLRPVFTRENSYNEEVADVFAVRVAHGVMLLLLFIFLYFLIPIFIRDKKEGLYKLLNTPKIFIYYFTLLIAVFIVLFLLSLFALLLLKITAPQALLPLGSELIGITVYLVCVSCIALFCVLTLKSGEPVYAGFIFVLIIQVMFGSLFLDIREFSGFLGQFQFLPSSYYINFLMSSGSVFVPVLVTFIFIVLNSVLIFVQKK